MYNRCSGRQVLKAIFFNMKVFTASYKIIIEGGFYG